VRKLADQSRRSEAQHRDRAYCFQGATARNQALVAAFEHRLNKPIFVSQFCHLTAALGSALIAGGKRRENSAFRGLSPLFGKYSGGK